MRINKSLITYTPTSGAGSGTVTSVALTAPTGFTVTGSPITSAGTLALAFTAGYALPTTAKQTQWDAAYTFTNAFPTGTASQLLRYNTLGTALEFFTPSYLAAIDILASSPLVWNSATKTMSISLATSLSNGYLSNTDWALFNSKQSAIALTTTGNSGAATFASSTLNIPNYTLAGLGGMANVFTSLGDIVYSNAAGAPLRLAANGTITNKFLLSVNGNSPTWAQITAADVSGLISGTGTSGKLTKWTGTSTLGDSIITESTNTLDISASVASTLKIANFRNTSASGFVSIGIDRAGSNRYSLIEHSTAGTTDWWVGTAYNAGGANDNYTIGRGINLSDAKFNVLTTGQIKLNNYVSTTSFTGIVQGYLAFTSGGSIITTATPGGVSGTQNYLAKFDSTGIAVGNSRIVDDGTNFLLNGATSVVTGLNLVGNISATDSQGGSILLRRSAVPTSGQSLAIIDAYGITTGSTYQQGGGFEFRASQNWNSTSAGTDIAVQTAPDNTIAPADMFVFLNNGAVRFIGRTSNPLGVLAGTMYYNSSANEMRYYNGTSWISF